MKTDRELIQKAMIKMKNVDNFDQRVPAELYGFVTFFYANRKKIYENSQNPDHIYNVFSDWLDHR